MNKILVTGAAGFIGYHLCKILINKGFFVIGIDNINSYYDINLKYNRLEDLGVDTNSASQFNNVIKSKKFLNLFSFVRMNIEDRKALPNLFRNYEFDIVCNLAAQAGVRYSIENPEVYVDSNIVGFLNVMECCRNHKIKHLIYASSSSVYGLNKKIPFEISDNVEINIAPGMITDLYSVNEVKKIMGTSSSPAAFRISTAAL